MKKLKTLFLMLLFSLFITTSCNKATISDIVSSRGKDEQSHEKIEQIDKIVDSIELEINKDSSIAIANSEYDSIVIVKDKGRTDTIKTITEEDNKTMLSLPIAEINAKGQIFVFLIDTRSPISFIDEQTVQDKKLVVETDSNISEIARIAYILQDKFYVKPTIRTTKLSVKFHTGKDIDGVIGSDILHKGNDSLLINEKRYDNGNRMNLLTTTTALNLN